MIPPLIIMRISPLIPLTASVSLLLLLIGLMIRRYERLELADRVMLVAFIISFSFLTGIFVVVSNYVPDLRIPFLLVAIPGLLPVLLNQVVKQYQSVKRKKEQKGEQERG